MGTFEPLRLEGFDFGVGPNLSSLFDHRLLKENEDRGDVSLEYVNVKVSSSIHEGMDEPLVTPSTQSSI